MISDSSAVMVLLYSRQDKAVFARTCHIMSVKSICQLSYTRLQLVSQDEKEAQNLPSQYIAFCCRVTVSC